MNDQNLGVSPHHILEDAYALSVLLTDTDGDLFLNEHSTGQFYRKAGSIHLYDYKLRWTAEFRSPLAAVNYHIHRNVLEAFTQEDDLTAFHCVKKELGVPLRDDVAYAITAALVPAFMAPEETNALFLDHAGLAICAHFIAAHCDVARLRETEGRLAPWQERRAKDLINANLLTGIPLQKLAEECRLSVGHFSRAFKASTGLAPHQWLIVRRLEKAKELLLHTKVSVSDVSNQSGFADQSHMSRHFTRAFGASPAAWRKRNA